MRIAYFDCPSGIAGNMILGALLDAGLDINELKRELRKLQIIRQGRTNYKLSAEGGQTTRTGKLGFRATHFDARVKSDISRRNLPEVLAIINKSLLSQKIKHISANIFRRLAEAEAKVHGESVNQVHFHDVGAIDAIIDIVGSVIGFDKLGIKKIYCSPLPHGTGLIRHAHGSLPNPAPATVELLKGIPTYGTNYKGELVTPTGAAIIAELAEGFGPAPKMEIEFFGCGAGTIDLPIVNITRLFIGEALAATENDAIVQIETNIDDMNPKLYDKAIKKIMLAGALDAYITPIRMKKQREAVSLIVLTDVEHKDGALDEIFNQTSTFGVRLFLVSREKLSRRLKTVKTKYGNVKVKVGTMGRKTMTLAPEHEDCKKLAAKHRSPITRIHQAALKSAVCSSRCRDAALTNPSKIG